MGCTACRCKLNWVLFPNKKLSDQSKLAVVFEEVMTSLLSFFVSPGSSAPLFDKACLDPPHLLSLTTP